MKQLYIDYKKLGDAIKYVANKNTPEGFTRRQYLSSIGVDSDIIDKLRGRLIKNPKKTISLKSLQKCFKAFNLNAERFVYFAELPKENQGIFDPELDIDHNPRKPRVTLKEKTRLEVLRNKVETQTYENALGTELTYANYGMVSNPERLYKLTGQIAQLFKTKYPMLSVLQIKVVNPVEDANKEESTKLINDEIIIRCSVNNDVYVDFRFSYNKKNDLTSCLDVINNIIDESFLSRKAFTPVDPSVLMQYLTILKRQTSLYRKI